MYRPRASEHSPSARYVRSLPYSKSPRDLGGGLNQQNQQTGRISGQLSKATRKEPVGKKNAVQENGDAKEKRGLEERNGSGSPPPQTLRDIMQKIETGEQDKKDNLQRGDKEIMKGDIHAEAARDGGENQ